MGNNNKILLGLLVLLTLFCKAQEIKILNIPQGPVVKSPQTNDMERFGNVPVSLNTGNISYDINLFSYGNIYNENGLDIDIKYYGTGFMPSKQSNYVGLDWSLYFGGSISREVRGVADDLASDWPFTPSNNLLGYLEGVRICNKLNTDIYNQNYSMFPIGNGGKGIKCGAYSYELEPDKFNFNFMGVSGYFFIGNNQKPIIISDTPNLEIDISGLESKQYTSKIDINRCKTKLTTITITDGRGIKYYFGGEYDNLEVSYNLLQDSPQLDSPFTITSWNLYKIEYPNSKVLEIKYLPSNMKLSERSFCNGGTGNLVGSVQEPFLLMFDQHHITRHYIQESNYNYNTSTGHTVFWDGTIYWGNGSHVSSGATNSFSATKKSMPGSIVLDGKEIVKFKFERFDQYLGYTIPSLKLKTITFYDNAGKSVKEVELNYYRHKNYFFLDKIKLFRKEPLSQDFLQEYSFDYYNKDNLPVENIGTTDYWGYWNNKPKPRPIPNFTVNRNTGEFTFTGNTWDANPDLCSVTLLKSIVYPTKGKSEFVYEPQKYSEKLDRNYASQFKNVLVQSEDIVGGGRISKIFNYSNDGTQVGTQEYKYISNYNPNSLNTKSSGILSNYYRNYIYHRNQNGYSTTENVEVYSDNLIETTMNSSPVLYSEVTEIENNKGYTKYYFTDFKTHPDSQIFKEVDNNVDPTTFAPANIGNINLPYRSNNYKRSKLYKQEFYDQNFVKLKTSTTEFTDIAETIPGNYVTHVTDRLRTKYFFKQLGGSFVPKKNQSEDIFPTSNSKTITEMFYEGNNHLNLTKEKIIYPEGDVLEKKYQYAGDLRHGNQPQQNVGPYPFLSFMLLKNMSGIPIVTTNYKNNIFQNRIQSLYEYNSTTTLVLPKRSLLYYENETFAPPANGFGVTELPSANERFNEVIYDLYDPKGNLQQYTTKAGVSTTIIWGYNQTQPIAKIEGAKLSDITQSLITTIVNASNDDEADPSKEGALITALDNFRKNSGLFNYQITTYTYDPLIGVTSITPPSGIREVYVYDAANRLKEIRQDSKTGNLVKEFKYNYKN
ncbi:hypothetical protein IQ37_04485 [Chryseobacterium piperi]|uniref:YD repeat-containing protein n=1 Tax=Chryseobacterium piperi TaxID=558152 RepID=A0A086BL60_9FLAO|nr:hypothetical protein [Chryseobacterium piperi]ATL75963.1 hypothetical protein CJF12_19970 [Chryseobacterium piperi]KFF29674.1 hypothetical protein IQ37_04485 [Chryseobacterium piperi]